MTRRATVLAAAVVVAAVGAGLAISSTYSSSSRAPTCGPGDADCITTQLADHAAGIHFPAGVSANGRYLVDEAGQPYMLVGDSPQCLSAKLSTADMDEFFADRQAHGFNAAWVNLLCGPYTGGRPDAATFDGIAPFTTPDDLSTPNPAYFERMDTMVRAAAARGITLVLDPAETAGFRDLLLTNGVDKSEAFGEYLGRRYASAPNIIWMSGNDFQTDQWARYDPVVTALARGIRTTDPTALQTVELDFYFSTSFDDPAWTSLVDLNAAYTYLPTYDAVLHGYRSQPTKPVFLVEANYEGEHNAGGPVAGDETLRRQEYWTMLSGATGQLYGNHGTWGFNDSNWKKHYDTSAVDQLALLTDLLTMHNWQDLRPDEAHELLVSGYGTYADLGEVMGNDFAAAAFTPDGSFGLIYLPTARTIQVDVTKLKPGIRARWFDPTSGRFQAAAAPFAMPGLNAAGAHDWVLVFDDPTGP